MTSGVPSLLRSALASAAGTALASATRLVAAARLPPKPLHPHGDVASGRLHRRGVDPPLGVPWIDCPGVDDVLVRRSRALGLPHPLPDIHGLALRVPRADGGHGDLLFASTGLGRLTRFVLTWSRRPSGRPMTTLLPYRTAHGPLMLAAVPRSEGVFQLAYARPGGSWSRFGELTVEPRGDADALVSFDPVRSSIPGLENYDWVRRLREPSYAAARHSR